MKQQELEREKARSEEGHQKERGSRIERQRSRKRLRREMSKDGEKE